MCGFRPVLYVVALSEAALCYWHRLIHTHAPRGRSTAHLITVKPKLTIRYFTAFDLLSRTLLAHGWHCGGDLYRSSPVSQRSVSSLDVWISNGVGFIARGVYLPLLPERVTPLIQLSGTLSGVQLKEGEIFLNC